MRSDLSNVVSLRRRIALAALAASVAAVFAPSLCKAQQERRPLLLIGGTFVDESFEGYRRCDDLPGLPSVEPVLGWSSVIPERIKLFPSLGVDNRAIQDERGCTGFAAHHSAEWQFGVVRAMIARALGFLLPGEEVKC